MEATSHSGSAAQCRNSLQVQPHTVCASSKGVASPLTPSGDLQRLYPGIHRCFMMFFEVGTWVCIEFNLQTRILALHSGLAGEERRLLDCNLLWLPIS